MVPETVDDANQVVVLVTSTLSSLLKSLTHLCNNCKMYQVKNASEQDRLIQLLPAYYDQWRKRSVRLCNALVRVTSILLPFMDCQLQVEALEPLLSFVKNFYRLVEQAVKQQALTGPSCPLQSLSQLVDRVSSNLTPSVYIQIHGIQKEGKKGSHARKQAKLIPELIFSIEQYETSLIQINKKTKGNVNLTMYIRRSTARDFRIDTTVLSKKMEVAEDDPDLGSQPKRRKKKQGSEWSVCS